MMQVVISELASISQQPRGVCRLYQQRYRDLLVGIILNVTCNIENAEVTEYLISIGVVAILLSILVDKRHDWPTNGAALALLQFSH